MTDVSAGYPPAKLIFLLGIMPRSGTNYLFDLLIAHPNCVASDIREDFLVRNADHLDAFVQAMTRDLNPTWGTDAARLYSGLRLGLVGLLAKPEETRRVVTKTPQVTNLHLFFKLFPTSQLIIIIRDGRAVVESMMRSFKRMTTETAIRQWAAAARQIERFTQANQDRRDQFRVVRYEDLFKQQTEELRGLYNFLGLDPAQVDFEALLNLPVRGSSTLRGDQSQTVHWKPVAKTADFNPLERFAHWTPAQHARFNWIAGAALRRFSYEPKPATGSAAYWRMYNLWHDGVHAAQVLRRVSARQFNRVRQLRRHA